MNNKSTYPFNIDIERFVKSHIRQRIQETFVLNYFFVDDRIVEKLVKFIFETDDTLKIEKFKGTKTNLTITLVSKKYPTLEIFVSTLQDNIIIRAKEYYKKENEDIKRNNNSY